MEEVKRYKNFSELEIDILISLVKKNANTIENKTSNAVTWKEKSEGWEILAKEFEEITGECRSAKNLRGKWENLKKDSKRKFSLQKQETYKTGGGPYIPIKTTSQDMEMKSIKGLSVEGLQSHFDSDNIEIVFDNEENTTENNDVQTPSTSTGDTESGNKPIPILRTPQSSSFCITSNIDERNGESRNTLLKRPRLSHISTCNESQTCNNWSKLLRTPKSSALRIRTHTDDIQESGNNGSQLLKEKRPIRPKKKSDITNECKNRI